VNANIDLIKSFVKQTCCAGSWLLSVYDGFDQVENFDKLDILSEILTVVLGQ